MINLKNLNVTGEYTLDTLVLTFEIANTTECLSDYRLDVYRSNAPESDFKLIFEDVRTNCFEDKTVKLLNDNVDFYYKIMIIDMRTGTVSKEVINGLENFSKEYPFKYEWSETVKYSDRPIDNISYWLSWTYNIYQNAVIGNGTFYLIKKIRSGELCRNSDEVRGSCREPLCENCFGTGFQRGYYPPIPINLNIMSPSTESETVDRIGMYNESSPVQAWCSGYPIVNTGDIVINTVDRKHRMRVISVTSSYKNTKVTKHIVALQNITPSDIAYSIDINVPEGQVQNNGKF